MKGSTPRLQRLGLPLECVSEVQAHLFDFDLTPRASQHQAPAQSPPCRGWRTEELYEGTVHSTRLIAFPFIASTAHAFTPIFLLDYITTPVCPFCRLVIQHSHRRESSDADLALSSTQQQQYRTVPVQYQYHHRHRPRLWRSHRACLFVATLDQHQHCFIPRLPSLVRPQDRHHFFEKEEEEVEHL